MNLTLSMVESIAIFRRLDSRALCCSASPIIAQYYQVILCPLSQPGLLLCACERPPCFRR